MYVAREHVVRVSRGARDKAKIPGPSEGLRNWRDGKVYNNFHEIKIA